MKRLALISGLIIFAVAIVIFTGCEKNVSFTEPSANLAIEKGLKSEEINFVKWKPEFNAKLEEVKAFENLNKTALPGIDYKIIKREKGGVVGGEKTYGNVVEFPAYCFPEAKRMEIMLVLPNQENSGATVEFLPNQKFDKNVKVTLSYAELDFNGDPHQLKIYYFDEEDGVWYNVPIAEVNTDNQTIVFYTNHFTRYGWGF